MLSPWSCWTFLVLDGGHAWNPDPVLPGFFFVNESAAWNIFVAELSLAVLMRCGLFLEKL